MKSKIDIRFTEKSLPYLRYFNTNTMIKLDFTRTVKSLVRAELKGEVLRVPMHDDIREAAQNRDCPLCYTIPLSAADSDISDFYFSLASGKQSKKISELLESAFSEIEKQSVKHSKEDYEACQVDETMPHSLDEDFQSTRPSGFVFKGKRIRIKIWKDFFPMVCELMSEYNLKRFSGIIARGKKGRSDTYLHRENVCPEKMMKIPNADGYVNWSLGAKLAVNLAKEVLEEMGFAPNDLQVFIRADYKMLGDSKDMVKKD